MQFFKVFGTPIFRKIKDGEVFFLAISKDNNTKYSAYISMLQSFYVFLSA